MAWLALSLVACLAPVRDPEPTEADADTDADSDTDTDTDADADSDADVDGAELGLPARIDFGTVPSGCDDVKRLRIDSVGTVDLEVFDVTGGGAFTVLGDRHHVIAPGDFVRIDIRFAPVQENAYTGALAVSTNAGQGSVEVLGVGGPTGLVEDVYVQDSNPTADVLLVVDNSCSMTEEQQVLNDNAGDLLVELDALAADYQIAVITTDMEDPNHRGRFVGPIVTNATPNRLQVLRGQIDQGITGSGNERPLDVVGLALSPPLINAANAGFLRPGAQLTTIVLTDEDDVASVIPVTDFITQYEAVQGDPALATFTGIAGPAGGVLNCSSAVTGVSAAPAPNLHQVALGTGAGMFDICQPTWDFSLVGLAHVATGHQLVFPLSDVPADPNQIQVRVEGVLAPPSTTDGYTYLNGVVLLLGSWIPAAGEEVRITYQTNNTGCP